MSKPSTERTYLLYKTGTSGPDLAAVALKVESAPSVHLVNRGSSALLVRGAPSDVRVLASNLDGWRAEANTPVR